MASVFVQVDVEDATLESLSAGLQSELTTHILEAAVRNALHVPEDKRVTVEPFRNGIVLSVATAQVVEAALEDVTGGVSGLDDAEGDDEITEDERWAREALVYVREGLAVIQGYGG